MADINRQKEKREQATEGRAMKEFFGIRACLVGDELINEQGKVIAFVNRRAFHSWLRSESLSTFSSVPYSAGVGG